MRIKGQIEFAEILVPLADATVIVKVEDTRRADAPAAIIAEQRIRHVSRLPGQHALVWFAIDCPAGRELSHCALRVLVDVDASGDVLSRDYVSTQSFPLAGVASPAGMVVRVEPVG
jgi:Type III secretion system lipoprotein chaperone (YscW)